MLLSAAALWARGIVPLLPWVLPPVLGAVIGYVTNAIAIRMLFRPLREIRILRVRLPLTPGVIPRQRGQLADSIAQMVSRELLDEEAVRRQLTSAGFQDRIQVNVEEVLAEVLRSPLAALRAQSRESLFTSIEAFLSDALYGFFSSKSFIHGVRTILERLVGALADRRVEELFGSAGVGTFVRDRLLAALAEPNARRRIGQAVRGWLEEWAAKGHRLGHRVPPELIRAAAGVLRTLMPSLFDAGFRWLDEERTREELKRRGKRLLREVLERLNVLQRFLISAGQFDRTLETRMPEIIDDVLAELRDYAYRPETMDRLAGVGAEALERWRTGPVGNESRAAEGMEAGAAGREGQEERGQHGSQARRAGGAIDPAAVGLAVERLLAGLENPTVRARLARGLEGMLAGRGEGTVREVLGRVLHLQEQEIVEFSATHVLEYLSRKETSRAIAAEVVSFSRRFVEENQERTLQELLHVGPELQKQAGRGLAVQLIRIVEARLPALIESFDVQALVVEKINTLDVAQVEKLLMMVIARHLKWINVFGALLGAIIGFSQMALRLVM